MLLAAQNMDCLFWHASSCTEWYGLSDIMLLAAQNDTDCLFWHHASSCTKWYGLSLLTSCLQQTLSSCPSLIAFCSRRQKLGSCLLLQSAPCSKERESLCILTPHWFFRRKIFFVHDCTLIIYSLSMIVLWSFILCPWLYSDNLFFVHDCALIICSLSMIVLFLFVLCPWLYSAHSFFVHDCTRLIYSLSMSVLCSFILCPWVYSAHLFFVHGCTLLIYSLSMMALYSLQQKLNPLSASPQSSPQQWKWTRRPGGPEESCWHLSRWLCSGARALTTMQYCRWEL